MGSRCFRMQLLAVVLILQLATQSASLGLDDSAYWAKVAARKESLQQTTSEPTQNYWKADLQYFQHAMTNLSITERVQMAVKKSQQRLAYFHTVITGQSGFRTDASFSSPVYSNQGSYLMSLELGTPPKKLVAIADTGSDLVWVQASGCSPCFQQPNQGFDPSKSTTYQTTTCSNNLCNELPRKTCSPLCAYSYAYGDQSSTQGDFSLDTLTLKSTSGSSQAFPSFGFGLGLRNQGTFDGTDGLVGLGRAPLSLISQLGSNFGNVFSYCLVDFYSVASKTSTLLFGSQGGSPTYTPMVSNPSNPTFYYVEVVGIDVGGSALSYPAGTFAIDQSGNGGFILDSGTTVSQIPQAAYSPLVAALKEAISYPVVDGSSIGFDYCIDLSAAVNPTVPSVTFKFRGLNVDLPGDNIFLQIDNAGTFCFAMQASPFALGIFGNVQQQNFEIVHDIANSRIGFEPKTC